MTSLTGPHPPAPHPPVSPPCQHQFNLIRCEVDDPAGAAGELVDYCFRCGEIREPNDDSSGLHDGPTPAAPETPVSPPCHHHFSLIRRGPDDEPSDLVARCDVCGEIHDGPPPPCQHQFTLISRGPDDAPDVVEYCDLCGEIRELNDDSSGLRDRPTPVARPAVSAAVGSPAGLGAGGQDRLPEGIPAGPPVNDVVLDLAARARAVLEMDPLEPPTALGAHLSAPPRLGPGMIPCRCLCDRFAPHHRLRGGPPVCCHHWQQLIAHLMGDDPAELVAAQTRCRIWGHSRPTNKPELEILYHQVEILRRRVELLRGQAAIEGVVSGKRRLAILESIDLILRARMHLQDAP